MSAVRIYGSDGSTLNTSDGQLEVVVPGSVDVYTVNDSSLQAITQPKASNFQLNSRAANWDQVQFRADGGKAPEYVQGFYNAGSGGSWANLGLTITPALPLSPQVSTLSSNNVNDTAAGTGAQQVRVRGIDDTGSPFEEDLELDGQNPVSVNGGVDIFRINSMEVIRCGSGGGEAGTIYVGYGPMLGGVPANQFKSLKSDAVSGAKFGRDMDCLFSVHAGSKAVLNKLYVSVSNVACSMQIQIFKQSFLSDPSPTNMIFNCAGSDKLPVAVDLPHIVVDEGNTVYVRILGSTGSPIYQGYLSYTLLSSDGASG